MKEVLQINSFLEKTKFKEIFAKTSEDNRNKILFMNSQMFQYQFIKKNDILYKQGIYIIII